MMDILKEEGLQDWLMNHKRWDIENGELTAIYKFDSFMNAHHFIGKIAQLAEKHNHHPRIENNYTKVVLAMSTHDADNQITERDIKLAEAIEGLE